MFFFNAREGKAKQSERRARSLRELKRKVSLTWQAWEFLLRKTNQAKLVEMRNFHVQILNPARNAL